MVRLLVALQDTYTCSTYIPLCTCVLILYSVALLQEVELYKSNCSLGVAVMGGSDRPQHIFRQGDKPGIFIRDVSLPVSRLAWALIC